GRTRLCPGAGSAQIAFPDQFVQTFQMTTPSMRPLLQYSALKVWRMLVPLLAVFWLSVRDARTLAADGQLAAGGKFACVVRADGTLWNWGDNTYGQLGSGASGNNRALSYRVQNVPSFVRIAAGEYHTVALATDGSLWTWGYNYYGQLGNGSSANYQTSPQPIDSSFDWV